MSQSALALNLHAPSKWTIINGTMIGTVRLMNMASFSIGRSPDCDFVINGDPKCSRLHATVRSGANGIEITAESEKNALLVNGEKVTHAHLVDGDIVMIGDTQVQMHQTFAPIGPNLSVVGAPGGYPAFAPNGFASAPAPSAPVGPAPAAYTSNALPVVKQSQTGRFVLYGVIAAVVILVVMPGKGKKKDAGIRGEQQIQADIDVANQLRASADKQLIRGSDQSVTARQAQENYVRGFRDYERGQFERSLISFQSCLALNPEHVLCNRYFRLGQRKFGEVVQSQMVLGRKYRDQNQFRACRAAFRNVMVMIKDANSPIFSEAKANYDACDDSVEGHY